MTSTTVPVAPVATEPPVFSIPMSPNEDALKIYESTLRASVQDIVGKSGLHWTTLSLCHRCTDPKRLELCPPTIVVTTSTADPLKQQDWVTVQAKIREEIKKQTKIPIEVAIVQGTPATFQDVGLPYLRPPPIGYSFGIAEEKVGKRAEGNSGTLGGYLVLGGKLHVAMTCNHIGNPRDFVPINATPETFTQHEMKCPSNQDNAETLRIAAANLILPSDKEIFNNDKKKTFRMLMNGIRDEFISNEHEKIEFPAGRKTGDSWDACQQSILDDDYVTAMASLPTADELLQGAAAMKNCKLNDNFQSLRALFDELWKQEMANESSLTYRESLVFERQLGTTKHASGLRVWPDASGLCIVDWSLVETPDVHAVNQIPQALSALAEATFPGCALARGVTITRISALKPGETVLKIGRTSGATVGIVDGAKVCVSQESLVYMKVLPADGRLDGHDVISTNEWNVTGVVYKEGKVVAGGEPFALGGDSGAWVVNSNSELVGMVFGGLPNVAQSYVQDARMIWESVKQVAGVDLAFPN